jgi:hypothetical protein
LTRDEPIHLEFDGKRGISDRAEVVQASPALSPDALIVAEVESDLERTDRGDSFPLEGVSVVSRVMPSGDLQLRVCLDTSKEHVEPGRYAGAIQITGSEIQGTAIPLEATLSAEPWIALLCILSGLIVGLLLKALADLEKEENTKVDWPSLQRYIRRPAFVTAVVLGLLGAAISYFAVYGTNDTWGTTSLDYVRLVAVGVFGQVTGMTAVDVVSPFKA